MSSAELTAAPADLPVVGRVRDGCEVQTSDVAPADLKRQTARGALVTIGSRSAPSCCASAPSWCMADFS